MKLLKLFLFSAVFFAASSSLFAQKPIMVFVWPEVNSNDGENRVSSLLWEYYKSELATHARLKLTETEATDETRKAFAVVGTPDAASIVKICEKTKADILCAVSLRRLSDGYEITIKIFDAQGKLKQEIKRKFTALQETDFISVLAAQETAVAIRGENPVDVINKEREKTLLLELQRSEDSKKKKAAKSDK